MPNLLDIPLELRDQIIELVLFSCRPAEDNPDEVPRKENDVKRRIWDYASLHILHGKPPGHLPNCLPISLVNHQLYAETKHVLARFSHALTYHLDLVLLNEVDVLPTWLCIPALSNKVETLIVTVRIFGTFKDRRYPFVAGDGGPPPIVWCFYDLLENFLCHGSLKKDPKKRGEVTIGNLILDFVNSSANDNDPLCLRMSEEQVSYCDWYDARRRRRICERPWLKEVVMRPEWLASFLVEYLRLLLGMGYHMRSYGAILHEQIGTIQVRVNGKLETSFDIATILANLQFVSPSYATDTTNESREWRKKALEKRKQSGFPVFIRDDSES